MTKRALLVGALLLSAAYAGETDASDCASTGELDVQELIKALAQGCGEEQVEATKSDTARVAEPAVALNVLFKVNSAELTIQSRDLLNDLASALTSDELDGLFFLIEGHTDTSGSDLYNLDLSERRADAVRDYLVREHGIRRNSLLTIGKGETEPAFPENGQDERNRRVVVKNLGREIIDDR